MFNKEQLEFLTNNIRQAAANAVNSNSPNAKMWIDVLLELETMSNKNIDEVSAEIEEDGYIFKSFVHANMPRLRSEITSKLDLSSKGIAFKVGNISYSDNKATITLDAFTSDSGTIPDKDELLRLDYASELYKFKRLGFEEKHFGKEFTKNGKIYEFLGFIPKGKTYKYKARLKSNGTIYKFDSSILDLVL